MNSKRLCKLLDDKHKELMLKYQEECKQSAFSDKDNNMLMERLENLYNLYEKRNIAAGVRYSPFIKKSQLTTVACIFKYI